MGLSINLQKVVGLSMGLPSEEILLGKFIGVLKGAAPSILVSFRRLISVKNK